MAKDAYYFPHDSNAKDDPKCVLLIEELQLEGYGIYWILIETLREQPDFKYPMKLIPALARRYFTSKEKMTTVIKSYGLFEIEGDEFFYSESLMRRMEIVNEKREKAKIAGMKSGEARRAKALTIKEITNDKQTMNERSTNVEQNVNNKRKVKEIKEKKIKEEDIYVQHFHLILTKAEYEDLLTVYKKRCVDDLIETINAYSKEYLEKFSNFKAVIHSWLKKVSDAKLPTEKEIFRRYGGDV
jgi:hypothetical protein